MSLPTAENQAFKINKIDRTTRSYALIEADPNDFDNIVDLFRQFFPRTRIVECNHQQRQTSAETSNSYPSSNDSEPFDSKIPVQVRLTDVEILRIFVFLLISNLFFRRSVAKSKIIYSVVISNRPIKIANASTNA